MSRGKVTIGYGSDEQKELEILDFVQAEYISNRLISISQLEDETFILSVENPKSSGRNEQSIMRLSEESFMGLVSTCMLYLSAKEYDIQELLSKSVRDNKVEYCFSDNLKGLEVSKK